MYPVLQAAVMEQQCPYWVQILGLLVQTAFKLPHLEHLLLGTWLYMNFLWFHFSPSKTHGCESGWLFSTLPLFIDLALRKQDLPPDLRSFQNELTSSLCRRCLFPWGSRKELQKSWGRRWKCIHQTLLISNRASYWLCRVITGLMIIVKDGIWGQKCFTLFFLLSNKVCTTYLLPCQSLHFN